MEEKSSMGCFTQILLIGFIIGAICYIYKEIKRAIVEQDYISLIIYAFSTVASCWISYNFIY